MIVNIGTGVAPVNTAFSKSRSAALIERKMLQKTKLCKKLHHCKVSEIKAQVFTLSDVLACVSIHCADQKQHSNRDFSSKSIENTLQTSVDIANDYLHAYNTNVESQNFFSLHQLKCAGFTIFLIPFVLSNELFRTKSHFFYIALGIGSIKQYRQASQKVIDSSCSFIFYG